MGRGWCFSSAYSLGWHLLGRVLLYSIGNARQPTTRAERPGATGILFMRFFLTVRQMLPSLSIMCATAIVLSLAGFDTLESCLATTVMSLVPIFIEKYQALPLDPGSRPADSRRSQLAVAPSGPGKDEVGPRASDPPTPRGPSSTGNSLTTLSESPASKKSSLALWAWSFVLVMFVLGFLLYAKFIF
jgi:hypothetical protein